MPGNSAERRAGQKAAKQREGQPQELRYYWDNPIGLTAFQSSLLRRQSHPSQTGTHLEEHHHPLPVGSRTSLVTREGLSQPALPFTWYTGDHTLDEEGTEITPPLSHLQKHVEQRGIQTLSNADLLTIMLRTNAGNESVVKRMHSLLTSYSVAELLQVDFGEFSETYGLSKAKAAQLQAFLELSKRLTRPASSERYQIKTPQDAATLLLPEMAHLDHETMRVLVLDTKNAVVANMLLYQGTVNSSVLRAAEIFRLAVTRNCPGVIIAHNHPSGDPTPSPEDISTTEHLVQAGKYLDVNLVDHLIIGKNDRFVSLKERLLW